MLFTSHFEKLSPGLKAKLDARYRLRTGQVLKETGATGMRHLRGHFGTGTPVGAIRVKRERT